MALEHRLLIFVFRRSDSGVEYLFERRHPRQEFSWAPPHTELGYSESLMSAALRSMRESWHAPGPMRWIDLNWCGQHQIGDFDLIDWGVGYGVPVRWDPSALEPPPSADLLWRPLPAALALVEEESLRRALFRLHVEAAS